MILDAYSAERFLVRLRGGRRSVGCRAAVMCGSEGGLTSDFVGAEGSWMVSEQWMSRLASRSEDIDACLLGSSINRLLFSLCCFKASFRPSLSQP